MTKPEVTLIQFEVAATRKLWWLWRLDTGSLNGLKYNLSLQQDFYNHRSSSFGFFVVSSFIAEIIRPYNGVCPLIVAFYQTDLSGYLQIFMIWCPIVLSSVPYNMFKEVKMLKIACADKIAVDGNVKSSCRSWQHSQDQTCPLSQPKMKPPGMEQTEWT